MINHVYNPADVNSRRMLAGAINYALRGYALDLTDREYVYVTLPHGRTDLAIRVYSTIDGGFTRARASDAIRVALIAVRPDGTTRGLRSFPRVYRVGTIEAIVNRMLARIEEAKAVASTLPVASTLRVSAPVEAPRVEAPKPEAPPVVTPVPAAPVAAPRAFVDPFATRTLANLHTREVVQPLAPAKPAPCVDGWEHYGAKVGTDEGGWR